MKKEKKHIPYQAIFDSAPFSLWIEDFSQVKQTLDALSQSGIHDFRNYFNTHPKELMAISRLVKIIDVNPFTLKLFKAPTGNKLIHAINDIFTENLHPPFRREILAIAEGKTSLEFETVLRTMEGKFFPCMIHWSALRHHEESMDLTLAALIDISGIKNIELALAESDTLYRALVEQSLVGVYLFDNERFYYVNEALANMMGYPAEEIIEHLHPIDFVHPEDRTSAVEKMRERLEGKAETARYTFRGLRKNGKDLYCEVFGRGITYRNRPAILGTIIDITEKTSMENMLREQMASLSFLNTIGKIFVSENSLESIMIKVLPLLRDTSHADVAFLYHQKQNRLVLLGATPTNLSQKHFRMIKSGVCICGKAMAQRKALYVNNISHDKRYELNFCHTIGITSFAALPLIIGDLAVGLLGLGWKNNMPQKEVRSFYEAIVDYLSLGLQNALLFAETKRQAAELEKKVRDRTQELQRMVNLMAGREIRMSELKQIIRQLRSQIRELGEEPQANDPLDVELS